MDSFPWTSAVVHYWLKSVLTALSSVWLCLFFNKGRCPRLAFSPSLPAFLPSPNQPFQYASQGWLSIEVHRPHLQKFYLSMDTFSLAALLNGGYIFSLTILPAAHPLSHFSENIPETKLRINARCFSGHLWRWLYVISIQCLTCCPARMTPFQVSDLASSPPCYSM